MFTLGYLHARTTFLLNTKCAENICIGVVSSRLVVDRIVLGTQRQLWSPDSS